jgi:Tol biopolymer transport system component
VGQVGSGEFLNLTKGRFQEPLIEGLRNVGFSDDDAHVWLRALRDPRKGKDSDAWLVSTMGGSPRLFLRGAVQVVWSPDRSQILYHTADEGDPIFVADRNGANPKRIFIEKPGVHNHYPTWSPDGRFVYFVRGIPTGAWDMDLWRIPSSGGEAARLTNHHSRVGYPTFLDGRTLLYTATQPGGAGSVLYAMDIERRIPHAVSFGLEEYLSVAASADGRRLVTTVANPTANLWTVPISDRVLDEAAASRYLIPVVRAAAPRFGRDYILYLSSKSGADGLWMFKDGSATELWNGSEGALVAAPTISPDGAQICFAVLDHGRGRLYLTTSDGTNPHRIAEALDVSDAPSWSPDGKWIAVVAKEGQAQPLFKVPVDGGTAVRLVEGVNYNPVWSPDGRFLAYSAGRGGASKQVKGVTPDGQPFPLPELWVPSDRYRFMPDGKALVLLQGERRRANFWLLDLVSGRHRQLTDLKAGPETRNFDISPDGKQILFDRYRENSDVVLIDLPPR